jgi:hypothetical protein
VFAWDALSARLVSLLVWLAFHAVAIARRWGP